MQDVALIVLQPPALLPSYCHRPECEPISPVRK
jgi:hypothetical protein